MYYLVSKRSPFHLVILTLFRWILNEQCTYSNNIPIEKSTDSQFSVSCTVNLCHNCRYNSSFSKSKNSWYQHIVGLIKHSLTYLSCQRSWTYSWYQHIIGLITHSLTYLSSQRSWTVVVPCPVRVVTARCQTSVVAAWCSFGVWTKAPLFTQHV